MKVSQEWRFPKKENIPEKGELQHILEQIQSAFGVHICVHDLTGVTLTRDELQLPLEWKTHGSQYCTVAKDYTGVHACMRQKEIALYLLKHNGAQPYCGICRMGVCDYIQPVILTGKVIAVVFASGVIRGRLDEARAKVEKQVQRLTFEAPELLMAYDEYAASAVTTEEQLRLFAEFTAAYILQAAPHSPERLSRLEDSPAPYPVEPFIKHRSGAADVILEYLEKNYRSPLSLKALSMRFFLSEGHINRLVHAEVQMGAMAYVRQLRLHAAAQMLVSTELPLRSIAEECGFKDVNYFCRAFREENGTTPAEFRRQNAGFRQSAQSKH